LIHFIFLQGVWFQGRLNPHNSLLHKDLQHFYQHVLSTLKVVLKKIEPPYSLYLSSCRAVFINTFCPITQNKKQQILGQYRLKSAVFDRGPDGSRTHVRKRIPFPSTIIVHFKIPHS